MPAEMPYRLLIPTLLLLAVHPARAQSVAVHMDADTLSVGEWTDIVLGIVHDGRRQPVFPDEVDTQVPPEAIGVLGDFELLSRHSAGSRELPDGSRLDSVVYRATTFALDSAWVAPVVGLAGTADTTLSAGIPLLVPVRSVVPEDAEDILDITPLAEFPRTWWPWLLLLAAIAAAWALWRRFRRAGPEPGETEAVRAEPVEPPIEEALRRLAALAESDLLSGDTLKPFFVELSDILRTYVARRTGVPAREMTTGELVRELRAIRDDVRLTDDRVADVDRLLQAADMVKFADVRPPSERARTALAETTVALKQSERELAVAAEAETAPEADA